jgi:hypothetical protein
MPPEQRSVEQLRGIEGVRCMNSLEGNTASSGNKKQVLFPARAGMNRSASPFSRDALRNVLKKQFITVENNQREKLNLQAGSSWGLLNHPPVP